MKNNIIAGAIVAGIALSPSMMTIDANAQTTTHSVSIDSSKEDNKNNNNNSQERKFVPITNEMRLRAIDIDPSLADNNPLAEEGVPQSPIIPQEILTANNVDMTSQDTPTADESQEFNEAISSLKQALVERQQKIEQDRADQQARREAELQAQRESESQPQSSSNGQVQQPGSIGVGEIIPTDPQGNILPPVIGNISNLVQLSSMDRSYSSDTVQKLIDAAKTQIGVPYVWGGTSPGVGLDCSGLTQWAYKQIGVNLPRTTYDQINVGTPIYNQSEVKPGDLIFPHTGHVGIAISSTEMIHAPQTGDVVKIAPIYSFMQAARVVQ